MMLKEVVCPNCRLSNARLSLERRGLYLTCDLCRFRELLWAIWESMESLRSLVVRYGVDLHILPICLRKRGFKP